MPDRPRRTASLAHRGALVLGTLVAVVGAAAGASSASAAKLSLGYQCTYPLAGDAPLRLDVDVPTPSATGVGKSTDLTLSAVATGLGTTQQGFSWIGAETVEGTAQVAASLALPDGSKQSLSFPVTLARTGVVRSEDELPLVLRGRDAKTSVVPSRAGETTLRVDSLRLQLRAAREGDIPAVFPESATDSDGDIETYDVPCRLDPSTQPRAVTRFTVAAATPGISNITSTTATVGWTDPAAGGLQEPYSVTYAGAGSTRTLDVSDRSAVLPDLRPATAYEVTIRRRPSGPQSPTTPPTPVATYRFTTLAATPVPPASAPGQPVVSGTPTAKAVDLTWARSTPVPGDPVATYEVYDGTKPIARSGDATPGLAVAGLARQRTYTLTVRAVSRSGVRSPASAPVTFTTTAGDPTGIPAPPGQPRLDATTATTATISWAPSTSPGVRYEVTRGYGQPVTRVTGTSATITGLEPHTRYDVNVAAVSEWDGVVRRRFTQGLTFTTGFDTAEPPLVITTRTSRTDAIVSWPAGPVAGTTYRVVPRDGGIVLPASGGTTTSTTLTLTGLTANRRYDVDVYVDVAGTTPAGALPYASGTIFTAIAETTPRLAPPTAPGRPVAVRTSSTAATVQWAASEPAGSPIEGYDVFIGGKKVAATDGVTTSATIIGLTPNTQYTFTVRANGVSYSAPSSYSLPLTVKTNAAGTDPTTPPEPDGPTVTRESTFTYQCTYPLIGEAPISAKVRTALPGAVVAGAEADSWPIDIEVTASGNTYTGMTLIAAKRLEGRVTAKGTVALPGGENRPFTADLRIDPSVVPTTPSSLVWPSHGQLSPMEFPTPGDARLTFDEIALSLKAVKADGTAVVFPGNDTDSDRDGDTFDVTCRLDPTTQSTVLATIPIRSPNPWIPAQPPASQPPATQPPPIQPVAAAVNDLTSSGATITWPSGGRTGSVAYRVLVRTGSRLIANSGLLTGRRFAFHTMYPNQPHTADVYAVYSGTGAQSSVPFASVTFTVPPYVQTVPGDPPPAPGQPVVSQLTSTTVRITWPGSATEADPKPAYEVANAYDYDRFYATTERGETSVVLSGLEEGADYLFRVRSAYGVLRPSDWSPAVKVRTLRVVCAGAGGSAPPCPEAPDSRDYRVSGSATLKTLVSGTVPLTGALSAELDGTSGDVTGDLTFDPATAKLTALGFLPLVARIALVPTQPLTGSLRSGTLTANAVVRVKLPSVTLFGLPLVNGANCQTKNPSNLALSSAEFTPAGGGTLTGAFALSDLTGCSGLTGLVSPLTAGAGNAIALKLSPRP